MNRTRLKDTKIQILFRIRNYPEVFGDFEKKSVKQLWFEKNLFFQNVPLSLARPADGSFKQFSNSETGTAWYRWQQQKLL